MYREQLAEIRSHFAHCIDNGLAIGEQEAKMLMILYMSIEHLQDENETLSSALHDAQHEIRVLKNKIKRQGQTLEFYADESTYDPQHKLDIMRDGGQRARQELARG